MTIHELRADREPFLAVVRGQKTFEYRKNDRDFKLFDFLKLTCDGCFLIVFVSYIVYGPDYDVPEGYCVMSISKRG